MTTETQTAGRWRSRIVGEGEEEPTQLLASPLNARIHPHTQEQALTGVLDQVGWVQRVIVSRRTGHVLDGHLRVSAAISRGEPSVPVVYVDLDDAEEKLILATLDPIAGMAGYDAGVLDQLLREVQTDSGPLQALLDDLAAEHTLLPDGAALLGDPDAVPDVPAEPTTKRGDLWRLGRHRLLVGDACVRADVERLMDGRQADMVWTDPPYGVEYEGGRNPVSNVPREKLENDTAGDLYTRWMQAVVGLCAVHAPWYVWFADRAGKPVYDAVSSIGYTVRAMIVWNKVDAHYGNFMAQYMQKHEPCLYCVSGTPPWYGATNEVTVWDVKQPSRNDLHPTQKPTELVTRAIRNSSRPGAVVLDPFLGSGTTIVAAEQEGRTCYGLEIDPQYADVCVVRWEQLTGQRAERLPADG